MVVHINITNYNYENSHQLPVLGLVGPPGAAASLADRTGGCRGAPP